MGVASWRTAALLYLTSMAGEFLATGKKTVDRITRTEGGQLADVMTCVE